MAIISSDTVAHCALGEAGDAGEDLVSCLDPPEGLGVVVVVTDRVLDRPLQFSHGAMRAALDLALSEKREPAFDLVQPGAVGGREVQVVTRPLCKPVANKGHLCVLELSKTRCTSISSGTLASMVSRNCRNSRERCRRWIWPPEWPGRDWSSAAADSSRARLALLGSTPMPLSGAQFACVMRPRAAQLNKVLSVIGY